MQTFNSRKAGTVNNQYLLVAAIDFGTTFSGYACSFKSTTRQPDLHEQIRTNKSWGAEVRFQVIDIFSQLDHIEYVMFQINVVCSAYAKFICLMLVYVFRTNHIKLLYFLHNVNK